jgi:hypothetical protein
LRDVIVGDPESSAKVPGQVPVAAPIDCRGLALILGGEVHTFDALIGLWIVAIENTKCLAVLVRWVESRHAESDS